MCQPIQPVSIVFADAIDFIGEFRFSNIFTVALQSNHIPDDNFSNVSKSWVKCNEKSVHYLLENEKTQYKKYISDLFADRVVRHNVLWRKKFAKDFQYSVQLYDIMTVANFALVWTSPISSAGHSVVDDSTMLCIRVQPWFSGVSLESWEPVWYVSSLIHFHFYVQKGVSKRQIVVNLFSWLHYVASSSSALIHRRSITWTLIFWKQSLKKYVVGHIPTLSKVSSCCKSGMIIDY